MLDLSHRLFLDNDWILRFAGYSDIMHKLVYFEFINTGFSVAKATLESQMSVRNKKPSASQNRSY